jgi:LPXTG-motif cell wall-anchored protein
MSGWRRTVSAAALMLALLPASAAAQSAGDEQYEDPFGEEQSQATPEPAAPAEPAEPAQSAPAQPAPAPVQPAPAPAAAPAQAAQLPRTGSDAVLPGVLGLILLAAGVALRAHVRRTT